LKWREYADVRHTPCHSAKASRSARHGTSAIKRDKIPGDAAQLLKPYLPPRDRKLRLADIHEMFEQMKDQA
jgi:hypothetical protein